MQYRIRLLWILAIVIAGRPALDAVPSSPVDKVKSLRADLDRIFSESRPASFQLGVLVFSLDRGETLYERNPFRLLTPASNNKIITAAVSLLRLGPAFRFETRVLTDGKVQNGALMGNLIIVGSGDPSYSARFRGGDPFAAFRNWATKLTEKGIRSISGDIVGDDRAFAEPKFGLGWEWNDLSQSYAAPIGALQFNENTVTLEISPGGGKGSPASIRTHPLEDYLSIRNRVTTESGDMPAEIRMDPDESNERVIVSGTISEGSAAVSESVSVRRPTLYYLSGLKRTLAQDGIDVKECAVREAGEYTPASPTLLWNELSPELSEILKPLLKKSQNLYAETLVRTLGLNLRGEGSFPKGKEVVEETLGQMGVVQGSYSFADGSGLSRLNLESTDSLVRVLKFMYGNRYFQPYYDALPVAGIDGTLSARMKGTKAENNVHAKTGSMSNVSSIAGYMQSADGEMLAFAIVINNFLAPRESAESMQDRALVRLARFSRKSR
jgi:serine-type D-Ala-D-Ala carboxypeptidase/endopeptidase (penicillin-binding protein 4)